MNCNEEFVTKALGQLTLELGFDMPTQLKIRDILLNQLYPYQVTSVETALVASDLEEKLAMYIQSLKLRGYSDATLKNDIYKIRKLGEFIVKPVSTITYNDLRQFLYIQTKDLKPSSTNNYISVIKTFFQWLTDEEYITKNPMSKIKQTKIPRRLRKSLSIEEVEKLRDACKDVRERAVIEFIFATGCRVSEVVNIDLNDINWQQLSVRVIGKGDKEREVYFTTKTKYYLNKYLKSRTDNNPALFVYERKPYGRVQVRGIEMIINKIAARAGFNKEEKSIYPHLLRHTMATLGHKSGTSIVSLQKLLGHEHLATTQIYAETDMDNVRHEYRQHLTY